MPTRCHFEPQIVDSDAENITGAADVHSGGSTDRYPCHSRRPPDRLVLELLISTWTERPLQKRGQM